MRHTRRRVGAFVAMIFLIATATVAGTTPHAPGAAAQSEPSVFVATPYSRLVDTKTATGGGAFVASEIRHYAVTGRNGVPTTGVEAVVLDVAVTSASTNTAVKVWTASTSTPIQAVVHADSGSTPVSNTVVVRPSDNGRIAVWNNNGSTQLNIDVQGYFTVGEGGFKAVAKDLTAPDGSLAQSVSAGAYLDFQVTGESIPSSATSVFARVTTIAPGSNGGFVVDSRSTSGGSGAQVANFSAGISQTTGVTIPLDGSGGFRMFNTAGSGAVSVRVHVEGYFDHAEVGGGQFVAGDQQLLFDSDQSADIAPNSTVKLIIGGQSGIPLYGAEALVLTINAKRFSAGGGLKIYPFGGREPSTSSVWFSTDGANRVASTTIVAPGYDGAISITNTSTQSVGITVSLQGWFTGIRAISSAEEAAFIEDVTTQGVPLETARLAVWNETLASMLPASSTYQPLTPETIGQDMAEDGTPVMENGNLDPVLTDPELPPADTEIHDDIVTVPSTTAEGFDPRMGAGNGSCGDGMKLHYHREKAVIRNTFGLWLYDVFMKKRWCASESQRRIGSFWSVMKFKVNDVLDVNFNPDAGGTKKNGYLDNRAFHLTKRTRSIEGCGYIGWPCFTHKYTQGIMSWYDGGRTSWTIPKATGA